MSVAGRAKRPAAVSRVFAWVAGAHPFSEQLQRFNGALATHPARTELEGWGAASPSARCQLSGRMDPDGCWKLKSLYASFQQHGASHGTGFGARTFYFSPKSDSLKVHDFPADPRLPKLADFLLDYGMLRSRSDDGARILRYVPRRRLTALVPARGAPSGVVVAKVLRQGESLYAHETLRAVHYAWSPALGFRVAAPIGVDENRNAFLQEALQGETLAAQIDASNVRELLKTTGAMHARIHGMQVDGLREVSQRHQLQTLGAQLAWVNFMFPGSRQWVRLAAVALANNAPDTSDLATCHGDYRTTQILKAGDAWSVIDFDDACRADPYQEIARFLAFLKYDVALFRSNQQDTVLAHEARAAYLSGYQESARRALDPRRLLWYQVGAEIAYLAQVLRRDLASPAELDAASRNIAALSEQLLTSPPGPL